jgi:hypothetical protein
VTPKRQSAILNGLFVAGLIALTVTLVEAWLTPAQAYDARAYWDAAHGEMYAHAIVGTFNAYPYSPAFLQLFAPILALPFTTYLAIWFVMNGAALAWLTRWWLPLVLATVFVPLEISHGNFEPLMALCIVFGFRYPAAWAFILLSKVTPGVGVLWFAVRREWRNLAIALGATALVAGVSFVFAPGLWIQWFGILAEDARAPTSWPYFPVPLIVRGPIAALLIAFGATRNWRWMVPIGSTLATGELWPVNLTLLVAIFPLIGDRGRRFAASLGGRQPAAYSDPDLAGAPG